MEFIPERPRRMRSSETVRALVRETHMSVSDLIYPMFVTEGESVRHPIETMPGLCRFSIDELVKECEKILALGIGSINLFGIL